MKTSFQENQKFKSWILWVILIGTTGFLFYGLYQQLIVGEPFGNNPGSNTELIIGTVLMVVLIIFFALLRLKTTINEREIQIHYFPVLKKTFKWNEVQSVKLVTYNVLGWGFRYSFKYGTVYNVAGNKGLAIELKSGKKYVIGTQKADELSNWFKTVPLEGIHLH